MERKENPCDAVNNVLFSKNRLSQKLKRIILLVVLFPALARGLFAQTQIEFPSGDFWSLDVGAGMSGLLVKGASFQFIIDPKLWLSPLLMAGTRIGANYSTDDILTFEGQVYLRWNFLRLGNKLNPVNIFAQAGIGMVAAYTGDANPFDNVTETRGSLLAEGALGITIPLTQRWHIEGQGRGGYPHLWGFSITAGYKFPLPEKTRYIDAPPQIQYQEVIRTLPPNEIIRSLLITQVEYILFGPDIGKYNLGIDDDAQNLNELVLNEIAQVLKEHPEYRVRIEGHANPVTTDPQEADELMTLSTMRANAISEQLKARGTTDDQMVVVAFGGTRTITSEHEKWERNRRVELVIIEIDTSIN